MYHIRFNCMNLDEFNKKLILKKAPISEKEILEAIVHISLSKNREISAPLYQRDFDSSKTAILGVIKQMEILDYIIYEFVDELLDYFLEDYNKLNIEQLKAINDYCINHIYLSENELLSTLKESGVLDENSNLEDLGEQVKDTTYDTMYNYLVGC